MLNYFCEEIKLYIKDKLTLNNFLLGYIGTPLLLEHFKNCANCQERYADFFDELMEQDSEIFIKDFKIAKNSFILKIFLDLFPEPQEMCSHLNDFLSFLKDKNISIPKSIHELKEINVEPTKRILKLLKAKKRQENEKKAQALLENHRDAEPDPKFIKILRKLTTLCRGPASIHSLLNDTNLFSAIFSSISFLKL